MELMDKININRKKVEQAGILERLKNRDITQRKAAALLNRTVRWTCIMLKRYKKSGLLPSSLAESRVKPALPAVEALFNPQKRN
jgi:hypothetical protein